MRIKKRRQKKIMVVMMMAKTKRSIRMRRSKGEKSRCRNMNSNKINMCRKG